jgi:hypothetical protein
MAGGTILWNSGSDMARHLGIGVGCQMAVAAYRCCSNQCCHMAIAAFSCFVSTSQRITCIGMVKTVFQPIFLRVAFGAVGGILQFLVIWGIIVLYLVAAHASCSGRCKVPFVAIRTLNHAFVRILQFISCCQVIECGRLPRIEGMAIFAFDGYPGFNMLWQLRGGKMLIVTCITLGGYFPERFCGMALNTTHIVSTSKSKEIMINHTCMPAG